MEEMKDRGLLSKEELSSIFSNIPTLLEVHTSLLKVLILSICWSVSFNSPVDLLDGLHRNWRS